LGVADDVELLAQNMRQLQIEWEKFFGGVERKPPTELKDRVEGLIRRYAYTEIRNNAERFRYQSLVSRYNTFAELWNKRLRAREEGRVPGLHIPRTLTPLVPSAPAAPAPPAAIVNARGEVRVQQPERETEAIHALFDQFLAKRREAGETGAVKFEAFEKVVSQQVSRILTSKGAKAVDFRLEIKDGKVTLKAKVVK
jgi:hypothetical protein